MAWITKLFGIKGIKLKRAPRADPSRASPQSPTGSDDGSQGR